MTEIKTIISYAYAQYIKRVQGALFPRIFLLLIDRFDRNSISEQDAILILRYNDILRASSASEASCHVISSATLFCLHLHENLRMDLFKLLPFASVLEDEKK